MLGWRRFVLAVVGGFGAIIACLAIFIVLMNPYGNLPSPTSISGFNILR
jgi:hypothetical protein